MTSTQPEFTPAGDEPTPVPPEAAFGIQRWSASSSNDRASRASIVLTGGGRRWHAHATGNGAIDALLHAVDDAVARVVGEALELLTYNVHATGHGHAAAAAVTVSIREVSADQDGPSYPGQATHPNVLEASLAAYLDAINALIIDRGIDLASAAPLGRGADSTASSEEPEARTHAADGLMDLYNP